MNSFAPVSFSLECISCGENHAASEARFVCAKCGGPIEAMYDYERLESAHSGLPVNPSLGGVWRYAPLLPLTHKTRMVTLGEGGTRLIRAEMLESLLGLKTVFVKDESRNPTLSFKDRKSTIGISKAAEFGAKAVASMTAGNAGSSIAAYAAKAGIPSYIFTIDGISDSKLAKLLSYGANVFKTKAPTKEVVTFVADVCQRYGMMNMTAASRYNPYIKEGAKTSAFEVYEQMGHSLPDWMVVPIGGGGNLSSIFKGLRELRRLGLIERYPRLVGVQGEDCAPVVKAFEDGLDPAEIPVIENPSTIAHSILDSWAPDGDQALRAIRATEGRAIGVSDEAMLDAMKLLSSREGVYVEPASAAPLAALRRMIEAKEVDRDESVMLLTTGSGSNQPEATLKAWGGAPLIELDLDSFGARIGR